MSAKIIAEATGLLSSVKKQMLKTEFIAALLAAQFSRERYFASVDRIADDCVRAANLVQALEAQRGATLRAATLADLACICRVYGASVEQTRVSRRGIIALRFPAGAFADAQPAVLRLN